MYLVELLVNYFKHKKVETSLQYNPNAEFEDISIEDCEHCFLPLDSTCENFACKYCGLIVSKEKLKDRNIFRNSK